MLTNAAKNIYDTLGPKVKCIYLMREPAKRAVSQYGHEFQHGECKVPTLAEAVDAYSPIVDFSRYSMQIAPFRELFGKQNILCLKFENLIAERRIYAQKVAEFVGADPLKVPELEELPPRNTANARRTWAGWARALRGHPTFQTYIEPNMPQLMQSTLRRLVTSRPKAIEVGGELPEIEARIRAKLSIADLAEYEAAL